MTVVRAAITQVAWTGDKESMIDRHEELTRDAAADGVADHRASRSCSTARTSASSRTRSTTPTSSRSPARPPSGSRRWPRSSDMVIVLPIYEVENEGEYYNTAAVDRRRRHAARQVPQAPHPEPAAVLGEVLLPPRQPRLPGVQHRGRPGRRLHLLRPALPRGLARARAEQRADRVQPRRRPSPACPTGCGRSSSRPRPRPTSTSSPPTTGSAGSTRSSATTPSTFYGTVLLRRPARQLRRRARLAGQGGVARPRPRPRRDHPDPQRLAVLPRPPRPELLHRRTSRRP